MSKNILFNFTVPNDTDVVGLWRTLQVGIHMGRIDAMQDLMETVEDVELIKATTVQGAIEQKYQDLMNDPRETLEFWFNWDYMLSADKTPRLMSIGTSGGFGSTRRYMIECVEKGDKAGAERCFWHLIEQSKAEFQSEAKECDSHWSQMWQDWLHDIRDNQWDREIRHFVRVQRLA